MVLPLDLTTRVVWNLSSSSDRAKRICTKQLDLQGDEETVSSFHQKDKVTKHGHLYTHAHLLTAPCEQPETKYFSWPGTARKLLKPLVPPVSMVLTTAGSSNANSTAALIPQLAGQFAFIRAPEVRDFRGCGMTTKNLSGMWSDVMGLWVCKVACKCHFLPSQNVKNL